MLQKRTFDPWRGARYDSDGLSGVKILVLGESHYGKPGEDTSTFTIDVVREFGQSKRDRFFTMVQHLVTSTEGYLSNAERADFWEQVAFYNYVQAFPGTGPRDRPTEEMWRSAAAPFLDLLSELKPEVVVVLGFELWDHLPKVPANIRLCRVQHPSSRGFTYSPWRENIQQTLRAVQTD